MFARSGRVGLKDLIELFWLRYTELQSAVGKNEADKIAVLERELEQLLERVVGRKTESSEDIREQFRFAIDLLNHEAEDLGCVQRNSELLRTLVDRYVGMPLKAKVIGDEDADSLEWHHRHLILDEDMLNDLDEPVVIVSPVTACPLPMRSTPSSVMRRKGSSAATSPNSSVSTVSRTHSGKAR